MKAWKNSWIAKYKLFIVCILLALYSAWWQLFIYGADPISLFLGIFGSMVISLFVIIWVIPK